MRVNRSEFLKVLVAAAPGLSRKEFLEQSASFAFMEGYVATFNDELACRMPCPVPIRGAIPGKELLVYLEKLTEDEIDIEQVDGEIQVKAGRKKSGIRTASEILLPIDGIEQPGEFRKLPDKFVEAINIAQQCCGTDASKFVTTAVNIHPERVEASDDYQYVRYKIDTGIQEPILIRQKCIAGIVGVDVTEISQTDNWLHFRNPAGLVMSARKHASKFPDFGDRLAMEDGKELKMPSDLLEAIDKVSIFSSVSEGINLVLVELKSGRMRITGKGAHGYASEVLDAGYTGDDLTFQISPKLLLEVLKRSTTCLVGRGRIVIESEAWKYVTATRVLKGG